MDHFIIMFGIKSLNYEREAIRKVKAASFLFVKVSRKI